MDKIITLLRQIEFAKAYADCTRVQQYVLSIPPNVQDIIFTLITPSEVYQLEHSLDHLEKLERQRNYVYTLCKQYNIPLRINESVERCIIRCRIALLKQRKQQGNYKDTYMTEE